jgi:hypothetical protein
MDGGAILFREVDKGSIRTKMVQLHFFNEGGANVLFSIELNTDADAEYMKPVSGRLLRLRKSPLTQGQMSAKGSLPPFVSAEEIYDHIYRTIALASTPALEHCVVDISGDLVDELNEYLSVLDKLGARGKREGELIGAEVESALLIQDMSPLGEDGFTLEFKPKWLTKSPGVENQIRCRTCAWQVMNKTSHEKRYCPHALVSRNEAEVRKQVRRLLSRTSSPVPTDKVENEITRYFCDPERGYDVLDELRNDQKHYDGKGVLSWIQLGDTDNPKSPEYLSYLKARAAEDDIKHNFLQKAMTLRDCTLFVRLEIHEGQYEIEALFGDLDPKGSSPEKLGKWASDEYNLRRGGYYHGKEARDPDQPAEDEICILWRDPPN